MANLTSNGQITSRDIRQDAVKTLHIVDNNIVTESLADLAVTVAKNNTVIDWDVNIGKAHNVSITTSWVAHASTTVSVPSWATEMALSTFSLLQATITSDTTFQFWTTIDSPEAPDSAFTEELAMTGTRHLNHTRYWEATVTPSSTITVDFWINTVAGSNSSNIVRVETLGLFRR